MQIYILGNGAMASAMAIGLKDKFEVIVVGRSEKKLENLANLGFKTEIYGSSYDISNKNIILAFKPYALGDMAKILHGKARICISVLAMSNLEKLSVINSEKTCVCMPNIAAKFKSSVTPYFAEFDGKFDDEIYEILSTFGKAVRVENEKDMAIAGVLSGCAPAFLAMVAESLGNGGVKCGLKKEIASNLVSGVFESSAKLLENMHPSLLKESVCSPAGTTIEGVLELEKHGIRSAFASAVVKSFEKSVK
ncbi:MAG: pyrroline-5-carboxylate reductase [Campylobacter sp.]|nr:pyrroline-5-carboxylate reductase [Campylobacter sp.]